MRVLVVGGGGFLGRTLVQAAAARGCEVYATYHSAPPRQVGPVRWLPAELRDPDEMTAVVRKTGCDVVVNAAHGKADWAVTAQGAVHVAAAALAAQAHLVHVSSDAVFSGTEVSYGEECWPDPVTVYGAAKAAAETGVRAVMPSAAVVRTSLLVGDGPLGPAGMGAHERLVHDLASGARSGRLFSDDVRCPVHVADLAGALLELAEGRLGGMFHCAGADAVSRLEFGQLVAARDGLDASRLIGDERRVSGPPGPLEVRLVGQQTRRVLRTRLRGAREFLAVE
ncbi:sugar nucleotide-binding protein [Streptomyces spectabilis]|uniref:dTDP-4-dehydrorhamnose reductase n=1 Tax=Streptomyces spectabilis TaxID=68270 RepID=A0A7W8EZF0_STRST|nr:sugar nucleotide-binding protein [Streptomyces spectabilis]MBB5109363.1 dTDP-4-dehydrorhamnose reductase [Streptomyces spectabilis]GGV52617.1 dTDP-4-dehydrorhamnose reductase [Streptomyces spectabilis]